MPKYINPDAKFQRHLNEALGFLRLGMKEQAIAALQTVTNDDDLIDQLYDLDMAEIRKDNPNAR